MVTSVCLDKAYKRFKGSILHVSQQFSCNWRDQHKMRWLHFASLVLWGIEGMKSRRPKMTCFCGRNEEIGALLDGGLKHFSFLPLLGEMIQFD